MTARAYVDVFCDECGSWVHGDATKKNEARENAKRRGFVYVKRNGQFVDLCPFCALKAGYFPREDALIEVGSANGDHHVVSLQEFKRRLMPDET